MIEFIFWLLVLWYVLDLLTVIFVPTGTLYEFKNSSKFEMIVKLSLLYILFSHFYRIGGF